MTTPTSTDTLRDLAQAAGSIRRVDEDADHARQAAAAERDRLIVAAYLAKVPTVEIEQAARVSRTHVYRILHKAGIATDRRRPRATRTTRASRGD